MSERSSRWHQALVATLLGVSAFLCLSSGASAAGPPGTIQPFAGGGGQDGVSASAAALIAPISVDIDSTGNIFIADRGSCRVREVSGGIINTVAGTVNYAYRCSGPQAEGISALAAGTQTGDVAVDSAGTVYIADTRGCRVRAVTGGIITTVAGTGTCGYNGEGPATSASLYFPAGIAVSGSDLYIADPLNCRVRKVSAGVISTVAGTGACGLTGDMGPATAATLNQPMDVVVGPTGDLYIADELNNRVRKVTGGTITSVAAGSLLKPGGVAVDAAGNLYIADNGHCRIREVSGATVSTLAGTGTCGYSGDGGAGSSAKLSLATSFLGLDQAATPSRLAVSGSDVYVADTGNCRVRKITGGTISTAVGDGSCAYTAGDGGPALSAGLWTPDGISLDAAGTLYVADSRSCRIRRVMNGVMDTVAGTGTCSYSGDNQQATSATLNQPSGVTATSGGEFYIADTANCRVRKVAVGVITTVAGTSTCGYNGDNISAVTARLQGPSALAIDAQGSLYISDSTNCRVRKVSSGTITTIAGTGTCAFGGDGGPATSAMLYSPRGLAFDHAGNLYIADRENCRVRRVDVMTAEITTVAGSGIFPVGSCQYGGDGGPATSALLNTPTGIAFDAADNLYIADNVNCLIRKVSGGIIRSIVGGLQNGGACDWAGDGGPATAAFVNRPGGVAVGPAGELYVADTLDRRIRIVFPTSVGGLAEEPDLTEVQLSRTAAERDGVIYLLGVCIAIVIVLAAARLIRSCSVRS